MKDHFFARISILGLSNALVILMLVVFLVPFAGLGARMALDKSENNTNLWLPRGSCETEEYAWYAERFASEQVVVATWQNCRSEDQRYRLFVAKLRAEQAPPGLTMTEPTAVASGSEIAMHSESEPEASVYGSQATVPETSAYGSKASSFRASPEALELDRARQLGSEYALFVGEDLYTNWGSANEKWLFDENGAAFYITPDGRLYRWNGRSNLVGFALRAAERILGAFKLSGQFVTAFGNPSTAEKTNPFYANPRLLAAPLFKKIATGPDLLEQLAGENGPLATPELPSAGRREAVGRLTGTLFGRAVPAGFNWSAQDVPRLLTREKLSHLPLGWQETWNRVIDNAVRSNYGGQIEALRQADPIAQAAVWHDFFDAISVAEPAPQTCVAITLTDVALRNPRHVLGRGVLGQARGRVFQLAEESGIAPPAKPTATPPLFAWLSALAPVSEPAIQIAGPLVENLAREEESSLALARVMGTAIVLGVVFSLAYLRSFSLMTIVCFVGGVSALFSLSAVWWANSSIDAILLTMPALVFVLGLSWATHFVSGFREVSETQGREGAAETALRHALVPCSLAALATAIGLASLCSSNLLPIRRFGVFSAIGVVATLVILFLVVPAGLSIFQPTWRSRKQSRPLRKDSPNHVWAGLAGWIVQHRVLIHVACAALLVVGAIGLPRIRASVSWLNMFDAQSQIVRDYGRMEQNFGHLLPMDLVVRFPKETQRPDDLVDSLMGHSRRQSLERLSLLERAQVIEHIQDALLAEFGHSGQRIAGHCTSALTFLRHMPDPSKGFDARLVAYDRMLEQSRGQLLNSDFLRVEPEESADAGAELWRIRLGLSAFNNLDYGQFMTALKRVVQPVIAAYDCRREVVRQLLHGSLQANDQMRGDVLVLGCSNPDVASRSAKHIASSVAASRSRDVELLFAQTLSKSLVNELVRLTNWHDPVQFPLDGGKQVSDAWGEYLSKFSCVIMLRDHADYEWDFIRQHNPRIVDARTMLRQAEQARSGSVNDLGDPVELGNQSTNINVVYSGTLRVAHEAQQTLLDSMFQSTMWTYLFIGLVVSLSLSPANSMIGYLWPVNVAQALCAGMVSMLPSVLTVVLIFGCMGLADTLVDIGTMMTASVAIGVVVHNTVQFLAATRLAMRDGLNRHQAIVHAYSRCAPGMTRATLVSCLGLSVFALSTFAPTQRFGVLLSAILAVSLCGDLVFLPALLAGPFGRFFEVTARKTLAEHGPLVDESPAMEADNDQEPRAINPFDHGTQESSEVLHSSLAGHERVGDERKYRQERASPNPLKSPQMNRRDDPQVHR